jgi:hypothetical protein
VLGSARQVVMELSAEGQQLPRRSVGQGAGSAGLADLLVTAQHDPPVFVAVEADGQL